jgi:hypothetical protein
MRSGKSRLPFVILSAFLAGLGGALLLAQLNWVGRQHVAHAARATTGAGKTMAPASPGYQTFDKGYRFERGGWIYVHLEGAPHDIGFQHGYLLAPEIADAFVTVRLEMTHSTGRDWEFFRRAAREMLWPKIDAEYQSELQGIVDGLQARKGKLDLYDIVAMNAFMELPDYYVPWLNSKTSAAKMPDPSLKEHCSAFVATGSWTKDHQIVIAHNNWTTYADGERWNIMFDILPDQGYRMIGDGFPGVIVSDDDFVINSAGMMITETTITDFNGWDPNGKAEFVRARKAMQYAASIDDFVKIMLDGNNGGYANDWLLGDRKTGEVARFENGLKHSKVWKTKDGYFVGSNFASDPDVLKDETTFDVNNLAASANARHVRWEALMSENKGKIDAALAQEFESDHADSYAKKTEANRRTLCGHGEVSTPGDPTDAKMPFRPSGAVQGKVSDSKMAGDMTLSARIGHPCGENFNAAKFLEEHPEYSWQAPILRDMKAGPWTVFKTGEPVDSAPTAPKALSAAPGH